MKINDRKCEFEACGKPLRAKGYCKGHYMQLRRGAELAPLKAYTPRTGVPNCRAAHYRLVRVLGAASEHQCVDGCGSVARDWSLDSHSDPSNLHGTNHGMARTYSLDPTRYAPRCRKCHVAHDAQDRL
jgi:hypothetical protein